MGLLPAIIVFSTLLPLALFCVYFGFRSEWYKSKIGRIILGLALSLLALLSIGLINYAVSPEWLDIVRVIVYGLMNIGVWRFFFTLRHVQRANDDGSQEPADITKLWRAVAKRKPSKRDKHPNK